MIVVINAFRMDQTSMLGNKNWGPDYSIGRTNWGHFLGDCPGLIIDPVRHGRCDLVDSLDLYYAGLVKL